MDKFILNSFINSTLNTKLIYNVISIEPAKKRVAKPVYSNYLKKNTYIYNDVDDYLIEFEECDDFSSGIKLFGKPNDWPFEKTDNRLFLQFDPLDSDMGIFNNLDGYIYFFFGKDNKTFKDIKIVEDVS